MTQFEKGDKVRLTKGENVLVGEVEQRTGGPAFIDIDFLGGYGPTWYEDRGWSIELIERPVGIPTEYGYYMDKDRDLWFHDGVTLDLVESHVYQYNPKDFAPFARLYTLEEAGKEFWGQLTGKTTYDPYDSFQQEYIRKTLMGEE